MKIFKLLFLFLVFSCNKQKYKKLEKYSKASNLQLKSTNLGTWGEIYCKENKSKVFLQAPHIFKDLKTKGISQKVYNNTKVGCLYQNTIPRSYKYKNKIIDADMAHLDQSKLNDLTDLFCRLRSNCHVIQIHGFSNKKRKTTEGKSAQIIISSGKNTVNNKTYKIWECLKKTYPETYLFPIEIRELGATKNKQKNIVHARDGQFTHIELSLSARKKIIKTPLEFNQCF